MRYKPIAALAALSLAVASSPAAAQTAAPAAPTVDRTAADTADSNQLYGGGTVLIIGAVLLALLIWGGIELLGDDEPASP